MHYNPFRDKRYILITLITFLKNLDISIERNQFVSCSYSFPWCKWLHIIEIIIFVTCPYLLRIRVGLERSCSLSLSRGSLLLQPSFSYLLLPVRFACWLQLVFRSRSNLLLYFFIFVFFINLSWIKIIFSLCIFFKDLRFGGSILHWSEFYLTFFSEFFINPNLTWTPSQRSLFVCDNYAHGRRKCREENYWMFVYFT